MRFSLQKKEMQANVFMMHLLHHKTKRLSKASSPCSAILSPPAILKSRVYLFLKSN